MAKRSQKRALLCCCCCIASLILAAGIAILVLRQVLKPKQLRLNVTSLSLQKFRVSINLPRLRPDITVILDMDLIAYNPNRASFKYQNNTVLMFYHDAEVAKTFVPAGAIPALGAVNVSTKLVLDADKVATSSYLRQDIRSGVLPVQTQSNVKGRINLWNIYRHDMVSRSVCDILLSVSNRSVISYQCDTRNSF